MKRFNYYLSLMLLLVFAASCNDEFDQPPMVIPVAEHTPNMTIAEFKAKYWQDVVNYIDTVKEDIVIHGWVTSSDESGNIYKALYISDGTAGLTISINQNSLYTNYRMGQEIVIPMKDMFVGKYNGQQQLGYPQFYENGSVWEATFLPQATWEAVAEPNGMPDLTKVDTVDVSIGDFQGKYDAETLQKYQGKLVRINGVHFVDADGKTTFSDASSTTNRNVSDGVNQLVVRTSNYSNFRADVLPDGDVEIVGLLSFYATRQNTSGTWQFYLRSADDVIGGGRPGTKSNPYTVAGAIEAQNTGAKGWVSGYAVGAVAPEVTTISGNGDIEWKAPTTLDNTLVLADDPECKDISKCVVVSLPQGSEFRKQANLKDFPDVYKTVVMVKGELATYMGAAGITGNTGSTDEFKLSIITAGLTELSETFDTALPSNWVNYQVSGDKKWYYATNAGNGYAAMTGYQGSKPPYDSWYITPPLDIKRAKSKILNFKTEMNPYEGTATFEVYILNSQDPTTATFKKKLNPVLAYSASNWSAWTESGDIDLSEWADGCYFIGFRYKAETSSNGRYATWGIDDVTFGKGEVVIDNRADFESMNNKKSTSSIGNYTSNKGWVANNCSLLQGGATDANPVFVFIGYVTGSESAFAMAPTLNGGTATTGTIVSPTIKGGMSKLHFNYGAAYSGTAISFRVDIKQNGNVVKSWEVTKNPVTQKTAYSFDEECKVTGDFTIEFTNLCPSKVTGNKDRASIWNVTWDE